MMKRWAYLSSVLVLASACGGTTNGGDEEPVVVITTDQNNMMDDMDDMEVTDPNNSANSSTNNSTTEPAGLALLGDGAHTLDSVDFSVAVEASAGLTTPRDLAFNPEIPNELWIVNLDDNSTTVVEAIGTADQMAEKYAGFGKDHFMARPSAIAFGDNGAFATAQEEDEITQPTTPFDFMGPTLWTSDRTIFDGGHAGHLDMLHNSPNGAGIAWERDNRYWVFDGYHRSITMYDFHSDHGPGGQTHADGEVARYVQGEVGYVDDVPSHLEFHDGLLYIADTGNNRIATLDPTVGEQGAPVEKNMDGGPQYIMDNTEIQTFVEGADVGLELPSGLEIHDGLIFVSDNKLSQIVAIDFEGNQVDYLDLSSEVPEGGLMGMAFAEDGSLYAVDAVNSRIVRVAAQSGNGEQ
jgi:hypothetical protein